MRFLAVNQRRHWGKLTLFQRGLWAALIAFMAATPVGAANLPLASSTLEACVKASENGEALTKSLGQIGWRALEASDEADFVRLGTIGFGLLYSGPGGLEIDWAEGLEQGKLGTELYLASAMNEATTKLFIRDSMPMALLFIGDLSNSTAAAFECVYTGPGDPEVYSLLDQLIGQQEAQGLPQINSEAHIAFGQFERVDGSPSVKSNLTVQMARFLQPMDAILDRPVAVEFAYYVTKETKHSEVTQ